MFGDDSALIEEVDAAHQQVGSAQLRMLRLLGDLDREGSWAASGARDAAHWLSMRYGVSTWRAQRWLGAARVLPTLPLVAAALADGRLGIDKVLELCRFATPRTEADLIAWAQEVSCATVRRRGDREVRLALDDDLEAERGRSLTWWWLDEGRRLGLAAELPAAEGAVVVRAIQRMTERVPAMPGEEGPVFADARRADALVALCSGAIAADPDPDRATVVVHTRLDAAGLGAGEVEGAAPVHPETVRRLMCDARVQVVAEDASGAAIGVGRITRDPPACMLRQVRYRDRGCRFPGCGATAFTHAHHIRWWRHGGRTDLDNLLLICSFHHRLVHEHGWTVRRGDGGVRWFRPDGTRHRAGPAP